MSTDDASWADSVPNGATPLDPSETEGLKLSWIATKGDLNAAEQASIANALARRMWRTMAIGDLLDDLTLRRLHRDMFSEVWTWAGHYRSTERNIGVAPEHVAMAVRDLAADALTWLTGEGRRMLDEAAVAFHHRLVWIHPFSNGNGRHARAATDLLLRSCGATSFTWGSDSLLVASEARRRYLDALRSADGGDLQPLLDFVRT